MSSDGSVNIGDATSSKEGGNTVNSVPLVGSVARRRRRPLSTDSRPQDEIPLITIDDDSNSEEPKTTGLKDNGIAAPKAYQASSGATKRLKLTGPPPPIRPRPESSKSMPLLRPCTKTPIGRHIHSIMQSSLLAVETQTTGNEERLSNLRTHEAHKRFNGIAKEAGKGTILQSHQAWSEFNKDKAERAAQLGKLGKSKLSTNADARAKKITQTKGASSRSSSDESFRTIVSLLYDKFIAEQLRKNHSLHLIQHKLKCMVLKMKISEATMKTFEQDLRLELQFVDITGAVVEVNKKCNKTLEQNNKNISLVAGKAGKAWSSSRAGSIGENLSALEKSTRSESSTQNKSEKAKSPECENVEHAGCLGKEKLVDSSTPMPNRKGNNEIQNTCASFVTLNEVKTVEMPHNIVSLDVAKFLDTPANGNPLNRSDTVEVSKMPGDFDSAKTRDNVAYSNTPEDLDLTKTPHETVVHPKTRKAVGSSKTQVEPMSSKTPEKPVYSKTNEEPTSSKTVDNIKKIEDKTLDKKQRRQAATKKLNDRRRQKDNELKEAGGTVSRHAKDWKQRLAKRENLTPEDREAKRKKNNEYHRLRREKLQEEQKGKSAPTPQSGIFSDEFLSIFTNKK